MKYLSSLLGVALAIGIVLPTTTFAVNIKAQSGAGLKLGIHKQEARAALAASATTTATVTTTTNGTTTAPRPIRQADFNGTVLAVGSSTFTLETKNRGVQTVTVNASTTIKKNNESMNFTDLLAGAKVRVRGAWDRANSVVTAKVVNIIVKLRKIHISGTVTAKSGASLTVLGNNNTSYVVDTAHSVIVRRYFGRTGIGEVSVGDKINVWAKHEVGSTKLAAYLIQDLSLVKKPATSTTATSTSAIATSTAN